MQLNCTPLFKHCLFLLSFCHMYFKAVTLWTFLQLKYWFHCKIFRHISQTVVLLGTHPIHAVHSISLLNVVDHRWIIMKTPYMYYKFLPSPCILHVRSHFMLTSAWLKKLLLGPITLQASELTHQFFYVCVFFIRMTCRGSETKWWEKSEQRDYGLWNYCCWLLNMQLN